MLQDILDLYLWLIPLALLVAFLKSPTFKGWFGEKQVSAKAGHRLPADQYHAFDNVTIPDGAGTTQIDHIYVSRFGVFVVETKNMGGWIFGDAKQRQWTQTIYRKKTRCQNPIHQNYKHIKALEALLGFPESKLHTVIVFAGDSVFKTKMPGCVRRLHDFTDYIRGFTTPVLTDAEVHGACERIGSGRLIANRATHRAHTRYVRETHKKR